MEIRLFSKHASSICQCFEICSRHNEMLDRLKKRTCIWDLYVLGGFKQKDVLLYLLEVKTLAIFSPTSVARLAASSAWVARASVSESRLCDKLIKYFILYRSAL